MEEQLIKIFLDNKVLSKQQLDHARSEQKQTRELLIEVIIRLGLTDRETVSQLWAQATGHPYVDLVDITVDDRVVKLVKKELAERFHFMPISEKNGTIKIAMYNPGNIIAVDSLRRDTKKNIEICVGNLESISEAISKGYRSQNLIGPDEIERLSNLALSGTSDTDHQQSPVVRLIDLFIEKAIFERATDIHISPDERSTRVNLRVDGIMMPTFVLPRKIHSQIITRIKVMSGLNIAEQRIPQDGKINYQYSGRDIDIRTSTAPTGYGENVVMRLLDKASIIMGVKSLGLDSENHKKILELSEKPHGIILSAGPTGSGKTTTLYSILQELDALSKNILTIEDPVEYQLSYIKQTQVNEKAGLVFSKAIRHFLRQDPDVILIGEIRDIETARTAFQAAMTGHLVLSTIHTNDAASCIARLMDLGIESYLIPSSLRAVMAQRLVRIVCPNCVTEHKFSQDEIDKYDLGNTGLVSEKRGNGKECENCRSTGYKGRTGIYEIFEISPAISRLIVRKMSSDQLLLQARQEGMKTMRENGIEKVRAGITTIEEVERVTG